MGTGAVGALGHGDTEKQPVPKFIKGLEGIKVTQVASGSKHSIALDADGNLYSWGLGEQGRLGVAYTAISLAYSYYYIPSVLILLYF